METEFRHKKGVVATAVGYAGGHTNSPTYESVCSHGTGHAESVIVEYDPAEVSYEQLLSLFWESRDHTRPRRQGAQEGDQYRSIIFYHTPEQKAAAEASLNAREASGRKQSVEIIPAPEFHFAEEYHQQYEEKGRAGSCRLW